MIPELNILEIKNLQKTNPEIYKLLENMETYYLQILSHTCHDLRNATGLIDGYVQLLEKQNPDLRANPLWMKLHKNSKSSLELLEQIGDFRYSHIVEEPDTVSLENFLEAIQKAYPDIPVSLSVEDKISKLCGNIPSIRSSIFALLQNAVEAGADAVPPTLTIKADGDFIHFLVADNGCGFDQSFLPKVFEPFCSDKKGHVGLGLSLARNTALRHGGNLILRNLHAPTLIDFYIPLKME